MCLWTINIWKKGWKEHELLQQLLYSVQLLNNKGECEIQLQSAPQISITAHAGSWGGCPVILQGLWWSSAVTRAAVTRNVVKLWAHLQHMACPTWAAQTRQFSVSWTIHIQHTKKIDVAADVWQRKGQSVRDTQRERENSCTGVSKTGDR